MELHAPPKLSGANVRLGPLQMSNLYTHYRWNNDPELNRYDSMESVTQKESLSSFKRRLEQMIVSPPPGVLDWEIYTEDDTLIGLAFADHLSTASERCRIGITICDRSYWGKGYGAGTMHVLLKYLFMELELHRVAAQAFPFNTAWRKLLTGMGFSHESKQEDYLLREGTRYPLHTYAILRPYYKAHADTLPRPWEQQRTSMEAA